jgi:hypothetical protein
MQAMLPFTTAEFFEMFRLYNAAIWPAQLLAYALGAIAVACLLAPGRAATRTIFVALAAMWFWTGLAYHWVFFTAINPAAWLFGFMFVGQGVIFLAAGLRAGFEFVPRRDLRTHVAIALVVYSAALYPLIGVASGHAYAEIPQFGVTPCPVTLFSLGFVLLSRPMAPWWLAAVPLAWSFIGGTAAFLLEVPQDWPLLVAGVVVFLLMSTRPVFPR